MKNTFLLTLTPFISLFMQGQDWSGKVYQNGRVYHGYYVTNNGDTVQGFFYHGSQTSNQKECWYYKNEDDKKPTSKFKPGDIKAWKVADKAYRCINYSGGLLAKPLRFNLIRVDGAITEFVFYDEDGTGKSQVVFHKPHDPKNSNPVSMDKFGLRFAKEMSEYLADYPELSKKVADKEKGYGMLKILDIIAEYNKWYAENKK